MDIIPSIQTVPGSIPRSTSWIWACALLLPWTACAHSGLGLRVGLAQTVDAHVHTGHGTPLVHEHFDFESSSGTVLGMEVRPETGHISYLLSTRWENADWTSSLGPSGSDDWWEARNGIRFYLLPFEDRSALNPYLGVDLTIASYARFRDVDVAAMSIGPGLSMGIDWRVCRAFSVDGTVRWFTYPVEILSGEGEDDLLRSRGTQVELTGTWWL